MDIDYLKIVEEIKEALIQWNEVSQLTQGVAVLEEMKSQLSAKAATLAAMKIPIHNRYAQVRFQRKKNNAEAFLSHRDEKKSIENAKQSALLDVQELYEEEEILGQTLDGLKDFLFHVNEVVRDQGQRISNIKNRLG